MKNSTKSLLILIFAMITSCYAAYGQDADNGDPTEFIFVKGIDSIPVGGIYTFTSVDRDLIAFQEIIDKAIEVLGANEIRFKDQFNSTSSIRFKNPKKSGETHYKVLRKDHVQISWVISTSNGIGVLAFMELSNTLFQFSVEARYL